MTIKRHEKCFDVKIPNTCYLQELSLLRESMSYLSGNPVVVEFGPLFGGSTYALLSGLNGRGFVHSYDCFFYRDWMKVCTNHNYQLAYGVSFESITAANICQFKNYKLHKCDLIEEQIWSNGPIDYIHLDAMKSVWIGAATISVFFPHLKVGGYIFDQDLGYNPVQFAFMALTYYQYREYLEPVEICWPGTGVLFKVVKALPSREEIAAFANDEFNAPCSMLMDALGYLQQFHVYDFSRTHVNTAKPKTYNHNSPKDW